MGHETESHAAARSLVVVGLGNIGSCLIPHLAKLAGVGRVVLIDFDVYERPNLYGQLITEHDIGQPKALAQARVLERGNPALTVVPICDRVENVPLATLRADLALGCLDSRLARQHLHERCWRMGTPIIDAGIEPNGLLARIEVYVPRALGGACYECSWSSDDYRSAALEQTYPCGGGRSGTLPTNAPSALGGLAASLQALESLKFLSGRMDRVAVSGQVLMDAAYHRHFVTRFGRNSRCKFDHLVWDIRKFACAPRESTLGQALDLITDGAAAGAVPVALRVEGDRFVTALRCGACGNRRKLLRLMRRLTREQRTCAQCGAEIPAAGIEMQEDLERNALTPEACTLPLEALGLGFGDVFTLSGPRGASHHEICESNISCGCDPVRSRVMETTARGCNAPRRKEIGDSPA